MLGSGWGIGGWGPTFAATVAAHVLVHLIELLFLLIVENGFDAVVGAFRDRVHLSAAILLRDRLVLEESLHLLIPVDEQRLDLGLLIGSEGEGVGQMLKLAVWVHVATLAGLGLVGRWRWCVVLGQGSGSHAKREGAAKCQGKDSCAHREVILGFSFRNRPDWCAGQGWVPRLIRAKVRSGVPFSEVDEGFEGRDEGRRKNTCDRGSRGLGGR